MEADQELKTEAAIFAGGCFWCLEPVFDAVPGVLSVIPGYIGGSTRDPSYQEVSAGGSGHLEAVRLTFDPARISYRELVEVFWRNIDPTTKNRQFCDFGSQYQSAIFYLDEVQRAAAEESRRELESSKPFERPIVTEIRPAGMFYPAEEYHHQYYRKNPFNYKQYYAGCGRRGRLKELWGK
jgi:peptide-methionine (S)-S-oxide reductase